MSTYHVATEFNAGFGWQWTVWRDGSLMSRRGNFETEDEAIAGAHRFMRGKEYTVGARPERANVRAKAEPVAPLKPEI